MIACKTRLFSLTIWLAVVAADYNKTYIRGERSLQVNAEIDFSTGYIVGGSAATSRSWFVHFGDGRCGGSLISPNRVLTAAHCVRGGPPSSVLVGATSQSDGTRINVQCSKTHPDYDGFVGNDVAIIKLTRDASQTPVVWNTDSAIPADDEALTVIGLGRTSTGGPVSSSLLEIAQNAVGTSSCDGSYGGGISAGAHLCAVASNKGSCNGDSGGPLFDASLRQVGIVSFGSSKGCASGVPDGYTRVSTYSDWITEQLTDDSCDGCDAFAWCRNKLRSARAYALTFFNTNP